MEPAPDRDPFARVDVPPRGGSAFAVAAYLLAGAALWTVWPILTGPLGMASGLVAHLKGNRFGFPGAVVAGVATVLGLAIQQLFFD